MTRSLHLATAPRVTRPGRYRMAERVPTVWLLVRSWLVGMAVLALGAVALYVLLLWAIAGSPDPRGTF